MPRHGLFTFGKHPTSAGNGTARPLSLSTPPAEEGGVARVLWLHLPVAVAVIVALLYLAAPDWTWRRLFSEGWGLVELAHFVIPLAAAVVATLAWLRLPRGSDRRLAALLIALAAGSIYIAGEEHSWGQHFFGWETPESWAAVNRQGETNLHNTTSWLNHKPRVALNVLVVLATIVLPAMQAAGAGARVLDRFRFVLPGRETRPVGLLVAFYMTWDAMAKEGLVPKIASREAEMHELFLYSFILLYAHSLLRRIGVSRRQYVNPQGPRSRFS